MLATLGPDDRDLMEHYLNGETGTAMGARLGVSRQRVSERILRIKAKLIGYFP